jgi:hypothetical protein
MKKSDVKKFASTKHKGLPNKVVQKEGLDSNDKPFVKNLVVKLRKGSKTHAKQADDLEKAMKEESNPRIPRKKGQPAGSKKHSDLYTDENPKGTIHGLGFKDVATAKASVSKIRNSSRSHAHKIQAAVAMEQRAREMGKTSEAAVYRKFINMMKKKTKKMNEEVKRDEYGDPVGGPKISKKEKAKNLAKNTPDEQHTTTTSEAANPAQQAAIAINMKKKGKKPKDMNEEGLRAWFGKSKSKDGKPGWVQVVSGKPCARSPGQKSAPKCVSSAKRASMTDAERKSAQRRKRAADPNQAQKSGAAKPTYVSTDPKKKKVSEAMNFSKFKSRAMKSSSEYVGKRDAGAIAAKKMRDKEQQKYVGFLPANEGMSYGLYKGSGKPSGAMAAFDKKEKEKKKEMKKEGLTMMILGKEVELKEKCWKGYEKKGMKTMFGKRYPNCVKKEEVEIEEKKMVKVKLNPEKKIGVKVTDIGPGGKEVVRKNTMDEQAEVVTEVDIHALKSHEQRLADMKKSGQEKTGAYKKLSQSIADRRSKLQSKQKMIYDPAAKKVVPNKNYKEEAEVVTEVKDKKGKGSGTKDACYHKVKSRYSVWPSAYASGALVKCRKVGAANWGNSSKKEQFSDWKSEFIWEDGDSEKKLLEDDMKGMSVKSGHKRPTKSGAGMTQKGVEAYRRRNPGSKLKTAVTTKPSKLKKGSKAANRRKSYCARSAGQMKKFPKAAKDPNSRLRQARRRWNC